MSHHHEHDHEHHDHDHEDVGEILTEQQRRDMAAYIGAGAGEELDDEALLTRAAEKIGLEGELAVDAEGVLELERDNVLVILESVMDEDAELMDHPNHLHLSVYLRPESEQQHAELVEADLLEEDAEEVAGENEEGWIYAWWGSMCTQLGRETALPQQLEALSRAMDEAEKLMERRDLPEFFKRMKWLELETAE